MKLRSKPDYFASDLETLKSYNLYICGKNTCKEVKVLYTRELS